METFRSLRGLERTGSTSRVLNLAALSVKHAENPEHSKKPLFRAPLLNASLVLKHRLRPHEAERVIIRRPSATKLIVPFERSELGLGGRSVFIHELGWMETLQSLAGDVAYDLGHDAAVLEAMDELPSLDPFLLREHLKRRDFDVSDSHFEIAPAEQLQMQQFVAGEISRLIELAYKGQNMTGASAARMVEALLSNQADARLEPLRLTLRMEGETYREGLFSWKGFLYYKWLLSTLWPQLREMLVEMVTAPVVGHCDRERMRLIKELRARMRVAIEAQAQAARGFLETYDTMFRRLTAGDAVAFRDFLLASPDLLMRLGESTGSISHIVSYWRFRFPRNRRIQIGARELLDILYDFETGLAGPGDAGARGPAKRYRAAAA
jgi:hypothetical protein